MKIDSRSLANWLVSSAVLLALLVYGRPLLVPLVFALLVWAVLNALTDLLKSWRLPVWLAWLTAFAVIAAALYFVALVLANEAAALATTAPIYADKLQHDLEQATFPSAIWCRRSISPRCCGSRKSRASWAGQPPRSATCCWSWAWSSSMSASCSPSSATCRPSSRGCRAIPSIEDESEQVIHAIGAQIQSYLGVCTFLSVLMGGVCYLVLTLLGVDFAGFWALVMFLLTYIPTIGGIGVALPALMALAQFGEVGPALIILIVLGITHFFLTNVVETIMLGRTLNLSPFAIILSLTFWGLVWGIGGLFLAVPMTGAVAIACRHLDGLGWIAEMIAGPPPGQHHWRMHKVEL